MSRTSANVSADFDFLEADVELAKAHLAVRIHWLVQYRRLTAEEVSTVLSVPASDLPALFHGRLASCSLDQLVRMLTWLGDDVEIMIRPRPTRTRRGALRVLQAAAVEKHDDFVPARSRPAEEVAVDASSGPGSGFVKLPTPTANRPPEMPTDDRRLLDKHALEMMTSLDITTIYRKMSAGTFPQPVKVGRRRVAWRVSDVVKWQQHLKVGTETARSRAAQSHRRI